MTLQQLLKPPNLALERLIFRPLNVRVRGKFAVHYAFHGHLFGDYFLNQPFHDHWHLPNDLGLLDHRLLDHTLDGIRHLDFDWNLWEMPQVIITRDDFDGRG